MENRTLLGSTHLFFTFQEDTNVGFRALLRFPDISNRVRITGAGSRGNRARENCTKLQMKGNVHEAEIPPPREKGKTRIERWIYYAEFLKETIIYVVVSA